MVKAIAALSFATCFLAVCAVALALSLASLQGEIAQLRRSDLANDLEAKAQIKRAATCEERERSARARRAQ